MRRLGLILPLLLLAAGCTPMRWEHPGFGAEATALALDECQRLAWTEARQEEFLFGRRAVPYRDRYGRLRYAAPVPGFGGSAFREQDLTSYCMRSKGFELRPADGSAGAR